MGKSQEQDCVMLNNVLWLIDREREVVDRYLY